MRPPYLKLLLLVALTVPSSSGAQRSKLLPPGWDLTYESVLDANQVGSKDWLRRWLGPKFQSPIIRLADGWKSGPIESSILLEFPAFHAAEHTTIWLVRNKTRAYFFVLGHVGQKPQRTTFDLETYDKIFDLMSPWQQAKPLKEEDLPRNALPGYIGFLSLYNQAGARQMLLTTQDFHICEDKECKKFKRGRVVEMLTLFPRLKHH